SPSRFDPPLPRRALLSSAAPPFARNAPKPTATSSVAATRSSLGPCSTVATDRYARTYAQNARSSAPNATANQYAAWGSSWASTSCQPAIEPITASAPRYRRAAASVVARSEILRSRGCSMRIPTAYPVVDASQPRAREQSRSDGGSGWEVAGHLGASAADAPGDRCRHPLGGRPRRRHLGRGRPQGARRPRPPSLDVARRRRGRRG